MHFKTPNQSASLRCVLAVMVLLFLADAATAATAMVAYSKSGSGGVPKYRLWDGTGWGAEASANTVGGTPQWLVLRGSPLGNQFALATVDSDRDMEVQMWTGTAWTSVYQANADVGSTTSRRFDIAYEQLSGHLLLVYRQTSSSSVRYRTYNGTSWSSESTYNLGGDLNTSPRWISLIPKPDSDEIMMVTLRAGDINNSKTVMWNGSSFSNPTSTEFVSYDSAYGAFEGTSGQGIVVYGDSGIAPSYKTLTSGTWSSQLDAPSVGATTNWLRLAADPSSNKILMATLDVDNDINVNDWTGTDWGTDVQVESNTSTHDRRAFHMAFEKGGTQALLVYDDFTSTMKYRTWDGFGWSSEGPGPTGTGPLQTIQATTGLTDGQVFVAYCTDSPELRVAVWNGSSFGSTTTLGTSAAPKTYENFMVAVSGGAATPKVASWREMQP